MKNLSKIILVLLAAVLLSSCGEEERKSDAFGNFEAVEVIVSSETNGKLYQLNVEEGMTLEEGEVIGYVDTSQLYLKKLQLNSQKKVIGGKFNISTSQADVFREQIRVNLIEKQRIENLLRENAASQKQLDDINGMLEVLERQVNSSLSQNSVTKQELGNVDVQIKQINDQIEKCIIKNPVKGTVIMKLAESSEIVNFGKPLYKIANLDEMELRVYVSGAQLPEIKIDRKVKVLIDDGAEGYREMEGTVSWISPKAEFTPKIIQTKEERVNLVYAVKVKVKNDGTIKIGMPGEVLFN
ncbi:MAG: HlyD family efflux transporter periplasmic adaptor subunit [Ignavibacteria bacterium]|nr:HlyD family efflux transporter periplasmic adaptor subunit [Ignavibacteria bacterium]